MDNLFHIVKTRKLIVELNYVHLKVIFYYVGINIQKRSCDIRY